MQAKDDNVSFLVAHSHVLRGRQRSKIDELNE